MRSANLALITGTKVRIHPEYLITWRRIRMVRKMWWGGGECQQALQHLAAAYGHHTLAGEEGGAGQGAETVAMDAKQARCGPLAIL